MDIDQEEEIQEELLEEDGFEDDSEGAPEWMVTYGDLVTLLLCFFVLLFSMSKVEEEKFKQVAASLRKAIGKQEVPEAGTLEGLLMKESDKKPEIEAVDEVGAMLKKEIDKIKSEVEEFILKNKLGGQVKTKIDQKGFIITISDVILFNPGRSIINKTARPLLEKMKNILEQFPYKVRIEGHTDNTPINTEKYPSNWELSTARACQVVRYFIEQGIPPERISAEGFAQYRPIATNKTRKGRAQNRRVEIVYVREAMEEELQKTKMKDRSINKM